MQRETHKHTQTETLEHTDIPEESKVRNHNIYGKCLYDKGKFKNTSKYGTRSKKCPGSIMRLKTNK